MIVGAGLAGVLLALLLERQGISYSILERAQMVKPLGSVMSISANIMPVLEQLGLLEEIERISKPCETIGLYDIPMNKIADMGILDYKRMTGYQPLVFSRPQFYELLVSRIPSHKILRGKRVLSIEETEDSIMISCADKSQYQGDIVVGADGAYSGVRQSLYKRMEHEDILPQSDMESMKVGYVCTVGTTKPMDPEKYPFLQNKATTFSQVVGRDLLSVSKVDSKHYSWVNCALLERV
ncbi:hypothetical protein BGZ54_010332 [Gamsiella multidivaricata]|nr:hypothetical protein BGZ54_010332 [Gamsiella multidivaricata]